MNDARGARLAPTEPGCEKSKCHAEKHKTIRETLAHLHILIKDEKIRPSRDEFQKLKEIVTCDIMDSINANYTAGNITYADAAKLIELTNSLYEQILLHYQERGGDPSMGVMLPGALELPHDDIIFKLEELEEKNAAQAGEIAILTDRNTTLTDENVALTDENATLTDKNAALTDENERLKIRIAELEASK